MRRKSQSSLEFLVTYSWAILALLLTLSAFYYFGILDFSKYIPQKCDFSPQMECLDFVMKETIGPPPNPIQLKLVNNLGETINVEDMTITNNANPSLSCGGIQYWNTLMSPPEFEDLTLVSPLTDWVSGTENEFRFIDCTGGGYNKKSRMQAKITLTYFSPATPSEPRHKIIGKISGTVS